MGGGGRKGAVECVMAAWLQDRGDAPSGGVRLHGKCWARKGVGQ